MATGTIKVNIMGGDTVTADNLLVFKIYGGSDGFTTAIHTTGTALADANVSIAGGVVTIVGLDLGSETEFKVATVDQAMNESDKSVAYSIAVSDLNTVLGADLLIWLPDSTNVANLIHDGTSASEWVDAGPNSWNAAQVTGASEPLLDAEGLLFDGTDDFLKIAMAATQNTFEVFSIVKSVSWSVGDRIFQFKGATEMHLGQGAATPRETLYSYVGPASVETEALNPVIGTTVKEHIIVNGASSNLAGGQSGGGVDLGAQSIDDIFIGSRNGTASFANVIIREFIVTKLLTPTQRSDVFAYIDSL